VRVTKRKPGVPTINERLIAIASMMSLRNKLIDSLIPAEALPETAIQYPGTVLMTTCSEFTCYRLAATDY
jgi:hypothetical protein